MKTVVFACRSNSCRSQMAEGWAREWIRRERENRVKSNNETRLQCLEKLMVASVALDASAVFNDMSPSASFSKQPQEECCCDPCSTPKQRKVVKSKAVVAMASDGVDISTFVPKTMDEVLPKLQRPGTSSSFQCRGHGGDTKPIDVLIILCSCGDDAKDNLTCESKLVLEWNVDAPTAAAKAGEGEGAYRRVSMEIRNQVNELMETLMEQGAAELLKKEDDIAS